MTDQSTTERKYLSLLEISKRWGVSTVTVRRLTKAGELPAIKMGRILRIKVSEVERYERKKEEAAAELPSPL